MQKRTIVGATLVALSAAGAILTTLVGLTDNSAPEYVWEAALLAGVSAASAALTAQFIKGNKDQDYDE